MNDSDAATTIRRHRHDAMATGFELRIACEDADYARRAATESFLLVDRLENLLSRFREDSEISRIGRLSDGESLRVSPETFECLRLATTLQTATGGAFDPALGHHSTKEDDPEPRGRLLLHTDACAVTRDGGPVKLDLGAIGKGYALDLVARLLAEWELPSALLIAGGSSLLALEGPTPDTGWEVTLTRSQSFRLRNRALGASGGEVKGAHILDPRDGNPCHRYARTWAVADSASEADALSTACMLLEPEDIAEVCAAIPASGAAILADKNAPEVLRFFGRFPTPDIMA